MTRNLVGVRTARNGPVLFVDAAGSRLSPGDRVLVTLEDGAADVEARVVIGSCQMLAASVDRPAGRITGPA